MTALASFLLAASTTAAAVVAAVAGAPAAEAKIGTGVGAAPIALSAPARAGSSYSLPSLWVVNTGDEPAVYRVAVGPSSSGKKMAGVPRGWVKIGRDGFNLTPGEGTWVPLSLQVPADAAAGRYEANLVAGTLRQNSGGAGLGAAAATRLQFTVTPGRPGPEREGGPNSGKQAAGGVVGAAALGAAAVQLRRRRGSAKWA